MSATCARCGSSLAPGKAACTRCSRGGAIVASAAELQYGLLDLDSGSDLDTGPAIETDSIVPAPRRKSGVTQRRSAATVHDGTPVAPNARDRTAARSKPGKQAAAPSPAPRAVSRPITNTNTSAARAAAAPPSAGAGAGSYGIGVMLDDNPFNQAFGAQGELPALEIEGREEPPPRAESPESLPPESLSPPVPQESAAEQRARAIHEIANYGPPPQKPIGAPMYCVRVTLRKRVLMEALATLSAQRKRGDDQAQAALAQLGESLYALRSDARLAGVGKQLKVVAGADAHVGNVKAQDHKRQQSSDQEVARIDRELSACERDAAPLRAGEAHAEGEIEALKAETRRVDMQLRKTEAELDALLRSKPVADANRIAALRAEREARHGELQTLGIQMRPLEDDLAEARRELAKHMRAIAVLQSEKQSVVAALDRAQQNHRVSFGSAKDGRMQALTSLASAGLKLGLGELVPDAERSAYEAAGRAHQKRAQEELHRAAVASFDQQAYSRGLMILLGGSGLLFLTLALLVLL